MRNYNSFVPNLITRLKIEWEKNDSSGVYGETQRLLAITLIK